MNNQRMLKLDLTEQELDLVMDALACMAIMAVCSDGSGSPEEDHKNFLRMKECKRLHDKLNLLAVNAVMREIYETTTPRAGTH